MKDVKLISCTQGIGDLAGHSPQDIISYVARVSNPSNQSSFHTAAGLLKYCIKHNHWSIFETVSMTMEINTTRGIAAQILRHRSFTFQEFSQRYADTKVLGTNIDVPELRRQDKKNRQNSTDDLPPGLVQDYQEKIRKHFDQSMDLYSDLLDVGVAKESARFVLPLATQTRIYMTGNVRSWITYIQLRIANGTQKEHQEIAEQCKRVFVCMFPDIAAALEWDCPDCNCDDLQPSLRID